MTTEVITSSPSVLRDRDFLAILGSKTSSTIASAMTWVILPLYVYRVSHSPTIAAIAGATNVVPYILFGLLAGVLVDRSSPRRVMISVELCNAAVLLGIPLLVHAHALTVFALCCAGFISATVYVWFDVASSALVPALVGPVRVFQANGYLWSVATLVAAVAAPAGFALLDAAGIGGTFAMLALFYTISAGLLCLTRSRRPVPPPESGGESAEAPGRPGRFREMADGFHFIVHSPTIRLLTIIGFGSGISAGAVYGMIVVFANRTLGLSTTDYRISWIMAVSSVGALMASFVAPRLRRQEPTWVVAVLLVLDVALMTAYALSTGWTMALVAIGLWNLTHTTLMIVSISVRQILAPPHMQGRVNAAARMLGWGSVPLGSAICGVLTTAIDSRPATLILVTPLAACLVLAGIGVIYQRHPHTAAPLPVPAPAQPVAR